MEPKYFRGTDMAEALKAVKETLGQDALILETRNVPALEGTKVEVTAMREDEYKNWGQRQGGEEGGSLSGSSVSVISEVRQEIAELKSMFCWLVPDIGRKSVVEELLTQGLSSNVIARLSRETERMKGADVRENIRQALASMIPVGGNMETKEKSRGCLGLIGPAGVGRTTTLMKLTIRLMCGVGCRVGWVNVDNRQIGGGEQAAVCAGVMGVPYESAETRAGLERALKHLSDCDVILIDTPGVSPRNEKGLDELARLLRGIPDIKCMLLLNATTNDHDMSDWVKLYGQVEFESLLFTKVDEGNHFGPLVNNAITSGRPVSYLTTGQKLTEDLVVATREVLADLILPRKEQDPGYGFSAVSRGEVLHETAGTEVGQKENGYNFV